MKKIEALLDAIGNLNGAFKDPDSVAYKLRNPLLIKSFGLPGKHETDSEGRRVFDSFLSGYRACMFDLEVKLSGKSRAKLASTDGLENILRIYGITHLGGVDVIVSFLKRALKDSTIKKETQLSYFLV